MKMSRKRAQELSAARSDIDLGAHCIAPVETLRRLFSEGQPTTLEECGFLEDTSEFVFEYAQVEPDWTLEYNGGSRLLGVGWYVYDAAVKSTAAFPWLTASVWKTQERAEAYLKLWKEDWWDDVQSQP